MDQIFSQTKELNNPTGSHIYFLFRDGIVVYIGKSDSLLQRIGTHQREKIFDTVRFMAVSSKIQANLETALIKAFRPEYNGQKLGKLSIIDKAILDKFEFGHYTLAALIRAQPKAKQEHWGYVAYIEEDGTPKVGYYDNDEGRDDDEHDDTCPYALAMDSFEEVSSDLAEQLIEHCKCLDFAVVKPDFNSYKLIPIDKLHSAEAKEFEPFKDKISKLFYEQFEELRNGSKEA